jgi:hypothetical protein
MSDHRTKRQLLELWLARERDRLASESEALGKAQRTDEGALRFYTPEESLRFEKLLFDTTAADCVAACLRGENFLVRPQKEGHGLHLVVHAYALAEVYSGRAAAVFGLGNKNSCKTVATYCEKIAGDAPLYLKQMAQQSLDFVRHYRREWEKANGAVPAGQVANGFEHPILFLENGMVNPAANFNATPVAPEFKIGTSRIKIFTDL